MPDYRAGAYVDSAAAKGERESLQVLILGKSDTVFVMPSKGGHIPAAGGLGFPNDDVSLNAKRAFAETLYQFSLYLNKQINANKEDVPDCKDPAYEEKVLKKLLIKEQKSQLTLRSLKEIGLGLRGQLNPKIFEALRSCGFTQKQPSVEPAMTFSSYGQAPVMWDMMYEEIVEGEDLDWEHFWGFRVPITHWQPTATTQYKIRLKRGLFSAIDENLAFASNEVSLLAQQLAGGLCHRSLCEEFRNRAIHELRKKVNNNDVVDALFADWPTGSWFSSFMSKFNEDLDDPEAIELQTSVWKEKAIRAIFSDPDFTYELIHFACHCEPDKVSELLTQLKIHIAGEEISLSVALMSGGRQVCSDQPGPLVFLNACGTGEQGKNAEPPGFPENWITKRGALAVVATLCPVPDLFAHAFARKFYNILFKSVGDAEPVRERYLSEALLETRRYFMTECNNPLGLAYVLYAVKDACIEPRI